MVESVKNFFQVKERGSIFNKSTLTDFQSRFFLLVFSLGVLSLYAYRIINPVSAKFSLHVYLVFFGITSLFYIFKYLINKIIGYVFLKLPAEKQARITYDNVISYLGIVLFPMLIFQIYFPENFQYPVRTISLIIVIIACLLIVIKLFQFFYNNIVDSFYIMLYLCTLEILPVLILFKGYDFIFKVFN